MHRAINQYALALRHWRPGHEILAVAHLFIASEALTGVALTEELTRTGFDRAGLAGSWKVEPRALEAEVRRRIIFRGDDATHKSAKEASDGFEHGFLDFDRVRLLSSDVRDRVGMYLREAILEHSGASEGCRATLLASPRNVPLRSFLTRYLWGEFVGEAEDLALPELQYPHFEWTSRLDQFSRKGRVVTMSPQETPTGRFSGDVQFTPTRVEIWGPEGLHDVAPGETITRVIRADGRVEEVLANEEPRSRDEE